MAVYEIRSASSGGVPNGVLDQIIRCSYARSVNNIGELNISLPDIYPSGWFRRDDRIYVQKTIGSTVSVTDLDTAWLIQDVTTGLSADGVPSIDIKCVDALAILSYYIVPYNANNVAVPGSLKLQAADDMMKAIVRENMGALASDTTRNISAFVTVQADATQAPIIKKEFSKRVVLDVLRELADASLAGGTYLAFDIVLTDPYVGTLEFRTYIGQRGNDHRFPSGNPPILLDAETDSLSEISLIDSHLAQKTYIYVGGAGVADVRPVATASDAAEIAASPFGRRELFVDDNNTGDVVVLQADADATLKKYQATQGFSARLNDQATIIRGIHWDYGDFMTASFKSQTFDVHADKIAVTLNEDGSDATDTLLTSTGKALPPGGPFVKMRRDMFRVEEGLRKLESIEIPAAGLGWYNVKDYGALADGTTNDRTSIQAAITAAQTAGGGIVYFPKGTYNILSQITVVLPGAGSKITLLGSPGATLSLGAALANNDTAMIDVSNSGGALTRGWFTMIDLTLEGNSRTGTGIKTNSMGERTTIERCRIKTFLGRGAWLYGSIGVNLIGDHFISCGTGCDIDGTTSQGEGGIVGCKFESCTDCNLNLNDGCSFMEIVGCTLYGSVPHKVEIADGVYCIGFRSCSFEDAAGEGTCIYAVGSVNELTVENCSIQSKAVSTTQRGIYIVGNLTDSRIAQNIFILNAAVTKTVVGVQVDGARTDLRIGPNRFSLSGAGTLTQYTPIDLPYPDVDLGGAKISSYRGTTGSIANTSFEAIFTGVAAQSYLVSVVDNGGGSFFVLAWIILETDGNVLITTVGSLGGVTVTNSGTSIRVTNNTGAARAFQWEALRIK